MLLLPNQDGEGASTSHLILKVFYQAWLRYGRFSGKATFQTAISLYLFSEWQNISVFKSLKFNYYTSNNKGVNFVPFNLKLFHRICLGDGHLSNHYQISNFWPIGRFLAASTSKMTASQFFLFIVPIWFENLPPGLVRRWPILWRGHLSNHYQVADQVNTGH